MALRLLRAPRRQQPRQPVDLNPDFADYVLAYWTPHTGRIEIRRAFTASTEAQIPWGSPVDDRFGGAETRTKVASEENSFRGLATVSHVDGYAILVHGVVNGTANWASYGGATGGGTSTYSFLRFDTLTGAVSATTRETPGAEQTFSTSAVYNDGLAHTAILNVLAAADRRLYVDGVQAASQATSSTPSLTTIALGGLYRTTHLSTALTRVGFAVWFDRKLPDRVALMLSDNPWLLFGSRRILMPKAAAAPAANARHFALLGVG